MKKRLCKLFPDTEEKQGQALADIWGEVIDQIFHEMDRISKPQMTELRMRPMNPQGDIVNV
ncbi:hypothetical protein [Photobacterium leiognathi]|uniref:hypothetical protein n=1 Tax=Photobacterium leiognathi TaxID=553611 RepID=UPI002739EE09|nr:hypothetical protein [Photobacterium leiognathi]